MNLRVALGAQRSQVVSMIVRQTTRPFAAGVAAGAVGARALGNVVASLLFEVQARDPIVLVGVTTGVALIGLAATALATRRGLTLDPAAALRQ
jgi:hypothetical protein